MGYLSDGMSKLPPKDPWGINFGGGLNSTALILSCIERDLRPDWILFADTGSEYPGTLEHVEKMRKLVKKKCPSWPEIVTVRWIRIKAPIGFEPIHENCLRTGHLPSKAYGLAGCTWKWKVQPMNRWRKKYGFDKGAFAVGYDASESRRIQSACQRGDDPNFTAWYPLVAWGIDREGCQAIVDRWGIEVGKSACFMCPNSKKEEWKTLKQEYPILFELALKIDENARKHGNYGRGGKGLFQFHKSTNTDDRCHHGGCFT